MKLKDFTYDLPKSHIAYLPPKVRGSSRLLVLNKKTNSLNDDYYKNIYKYLKSGDLLLMNDTKVLKARIIANKKNGLLQELIILEKHGKKEDWHRHKVLHRGKLTKGEQLNIGNVTITVLQVQKGGTAIIECKEDLIKIAHTNGQVPLPPYINRQANTTDERRYQTVWAKNIGSVAAPTASLNMTKQALDKLKKRGVNIEFLTLHVGLGTFMPIRTARVEDHKMHQEYFEIPEKTVKAIKNTKKHGHKVIALGTTVTRTIEFCADDIIENKAGNMFGEADIFIYPGYKFKIVDKMITNFHAPKSTVLMMTAAFAGWDNLHNAYIHAIDNQYKMLSYGDSMIIE